MWHSVTLWADECSAWSIDGSVHQTDRRSFARTLPAAAGYNRRRRNRRAVPACTVPLVRVFASSSDCVVVLRVSSDYRELNNRNISFSRYFLAPFGFDAFPWTGAVCGSSVGGDRPAVNRLRARPAVPIPSRCAPRYHRTSSAKRTAEQQFEKTGHVITVNRKSKHYCTSLAIF